MVSLFKGVKSVAFYTLKNGFSLFLIQIRAQPHRFPEIDVPDGDLGEVRVPVN
jgi:hypothetical protein